LRSLDRKIPFDDRENRKSHGKHQDSIRSPFVSKMVTSVGVLTAYDLRTDMLTDVQDDDENVTLKLRKGSPKNPLTLVRRLALRHPDLTAAEAIKIVDRAGLRISPTTVRFTLTEFRACYAVVTEAGLLRRDAEERREALDDDLVPIRRRSSSG